MVLPERPQTATEELANAASHGLGLLLALGGLPVLMDLAARHGGPMRVVGVGVFAATMILVYLASALYHALPPGRAKRWCNTLDHVAIYLFIAGSYTPVALGRLPDGPGWTLLGLVWTLAGLGALMKLTHRLTHPGWSTGLYVAMGWVAVFAAGPLLHELPFGMLLWLAAGGLAYLVGVVFFVLDAWLRFGHFVWHLCALAGSGCHVVAVLGPPT